MNEVFLGDICKIKSSKRIFEDEYVPEGVPFVRGQEISDNSLGKQNTKYECYISRERFNEIKKTYGVPKIGDILITAVGTIGNLAYIDSNFDFYYKDGNVIQFTDFDSSVDSHYLYFFMQSKYFKKQLENALIGAVQKALTMVMLKNIHFYLPTLDYQRKVVSILKTLEEKNNRNNQICSTLESMAKDIYNYWFVQFDFPDENGRPYKSSGGKMVWNEQLKREIPEGWKVGTVRDIALFHDSERIPLSSNQRKSKLGKYPYYGATEIMDYVDDYIFDGNYVLLAEDGSVMDDKGYPITQRITGKNWVNNHAHVLEPLIGYSSLLLELELKMIPVVFVKTGSIQMKINQENLGKYKVLIIPGSIISKFRALTDSVEECIFANKKEITELSALRDWLLPMLMNGQVKVG